MILINKRDKLSIEVKQAILEIKKESLDSTDVKKALKECGLDVPPYYINAVLEDLIDINLLFRDGFRFIKNKLMISNLLG